MPKFPANGNGKEGEAKPPARRDAFLVTESRCKVCQSPHRKYIERLIVLSTPHLDIERLTQVPRRSIANHAKEHLNHEEAAIRRLIEREADMAQENHEEGVSAALNRRLFLEIYIQKTLSGLLEGDVELTGKDAMSAIQMLDTFDSKHEGAALEEIRLQFNAYLQACREIMPTDMQQAVLDRTRQLLGKDAEAPKQIET